MYLLKMKCPHCSIDNAWEIDEVNISQFHCTQCGKYAGRSNGRQLSFAQAVPEHHHYDVTIATHTTNTCIDTDGCGLHGILRTRSP
jgi:hypothetical protein